jgi:hypothetical protein
VAWPHENVQPEHQLINGCCSAEAKGTSDELAAGAREDRTG